MPRRRVAVIWGLRAAFATAILVVLGFAVRAHLERPPDRPAAPLVPTPAATPRPTATREAVISRMARTTPSPTPRREVAERGPPRVSMIDSGFDPSELRVRVGQSVTWKNDGATSHDVSALGGVAWGSGPLVPNGTFARVFSSPGQYDYLCTVHPVMRGRIIVEP